MNHVILAINLAAFIAGSAAVACLRLLLQQRPTAQVRRMLYVILCLTFIVACNGADFYARSFAGVRDARLSFIMMNLLSLMTLASLAILFRFIGSLVRLRFSRAARLAFWIQSFCTYFACMAFSLFTQSGAIDAYAGFFISAIDTVACLLVAAGIVIARFGDIGPELRPFVKFILPFSLAWMVIDVASETGLLLKCFGLPRMAMSPYFLIIVGTLTISRSMKLFGSPLVDRRDSLRAAQGDDRLPPEPSEAAIAVDLRRELSARELDVLALLVRGLENAEISETLFISPHTVKNHVSNIYRKTGAKNRLDLIRILGASGQDSLPGK